MNPDSRKRIMRIHITFLIITAGFTSMLAFNGVAVESADYSTGQSGLANWEHKLTIKINPSTPVDDYQVRVKLKKNNFEYSKANSDGSDIRFYDKNNNKLDYWIEEWNMGGTSKIWVEVKISGTGTIYLYYGNPKARSESNGDVVFDFFDDFNDGVWEGKWEVNRSDGTSYVDESDGTIKIVSSGGSGTVYNLVNAIKKFEVPFVYETRMRFHPDGYSTWFFSRSNTPTEKYTEMEITRYGRDYRQFHALGSDTSQFDYTTDWKVYQMMLYDEGSTGTAKLFVGNELDKWEDNITVTCGDKPSEFKNWYAMIGSKKHSAHGFISTGEFDWIRVRKYNEKESRVSVEEKSDKSVDNNFHLVLGFIIIVSVVCISVILIHLRRKKRALIMSDQATINHSHRRIEQQTTYQNQYSYNQASAQQQPISNYDTQYQTPFGKPPPQQQSQYPQYTQQQPLSQPEQSYPQQFHYPPLQQSQQYQTESPGGLCPTCTKPLTLIKQENRYYCNYCGKYV